MNDLVLISEHACYGGVQRFYRHESGETRGPMKFSVYLPPQAKSAKVPALYFLSGLTCTEETFCIKSHAQMYASQLGSCSSPPVTGPREPRIPGDADHWDSAILGRVLSGCDAGTLVAELSYVQLRRTGITARSLRPHLPPDPGRNGILATPWAATVH